MSKILHKKYYVLMLLLIVTNYSIMGHFPAMPDLRREEDALRKSLCCLGVAAVTAPCVKGALDCLPSAVQALTAVGGKTSVVVATHGSAVAAGCCGGCVGACCLFGVALYCDGNDEPITTQPTKQK